MKEWNLLSSKIKLKFFELLAILKINEVHSKYIPKTHTKRGSETCLVVFVGNNIITLFFAWSLTGLKPVLENSWRCPNRVTVFHCCVWSLSLTYLITGCSFSPLLFLCACAHAQNSKAVCGMTSKCCDVQLSFVRDSCHECTRWAYCSW